MKKLNITVLTFLGPVIASMMYMPAIAGPSTAGPSRIGTGHINPNTGVIRAVVLPMLHPRKDAVVLVPVKKDKNGNVTKYNIMQRHTSEYPGGKVKPYSIGTGHVNPNTGAIRMRVTLGGQKLPPIALVPVKNKDQKTIRYKMMMRNVPPPPQQPSLTP